MTLSEAARERLADIVELQPTKNGELQDQWGMDGGSDVHQYLENELKEHYYRDDDSLIRATEEAAELVDVEPGVVSDDEGETTAVRVPRLQAHVLEVVPPQDEDGASVVATLHALRDAYDVDPSTDEVRDALQALKRKGVVEVVYTTVPTFRLAVDRDGLDVSISDPDARDTTSDPDARDTTSARRSSEDDDGGDVLERIEGELDDLKGEPQN